MGRAWDSLRRPVGSHLGAKMGQVGAKMALSWPTSRQDVAKMAHMERFWEDLGDKFRDLGGDLAKTSENQKNDESSSLLQGFWGSWGGSWRLCWLILALCWAMLAPSSAILADLALKLRPSWQDVSTKMPKMS